MTGCQSKCQKYRFFNVKFAKFLFGMVFVI